MQSHTKHNINQQVSFFILAIGINAFGNALTVVANMGSALWTSSAVNMTAVTGITLGNMLMLIGIVILILNLFLTREFKWRRILGNFIFMSTFSYLVAFFTYLLRFTDLAHLDFSWRLIIDIIGIFFIAIGVSIYQRLNIVLHPNDDFMQILRFKYFHGHSAIALWVSYIPPFSMLLFCFIKTGQLLAVNWGTLFALAFQGYLIGVADRIVFPKLKHHL